MSAALTASRHPAPQAGPDAWWEQPTGAGGTPPPVEPPEEPPSGGGRGPAPSREPGRRRAAAAAGAGGTLLLVVALLIIIWPALAVLVLAGAGAVLLLRVGLRWAWQACRRPGPTGQRGRVLPGVLAAVAFIAAVAVLLAPATAAWALGALMGLLLASACTAVLATAVRGGHRRLLLCLGGAVGLAIAAVPLVVPAAGVALAVTTVVAVLSISGGALLVGARTAHRAPVPGCRGAAT